MTTMSEIDKYILNQLELLKKENKLLKEHNDALIKQLELQEKISLEQMHLLEKLCDIKKTLNLENQQLLEHRKNLEHTLTTSKNNFLCSLEEELPQFLQQFKHSLAEQLKKDMTAYTTSEEIKAPIQQLISLEIEAQSQAVLEELQQQKNSINNYHNDFKTLIQQLSAKL